MLKIFILPLLLSFTFIGLSQTYLVQDVNLDANQYSEGAGWTKGEYYEGWYYYAGNNGTSDTATGEELWKTNGDTAILVADIWPGSSFGFINSSSPHDFVVYDSKLYFKATDTAVGLSFFNYSLWQYDGSLLTKAIGFPANPQAISRTMVFNNKLYFITTNSNGSLFVNYDGQNYDTLSVFNYFNLYGGHSAYHGFSYSIFQNELYFSYKISGGNTNLNNTYLFKCDLSDSLDHVYSQLGLSSLNGIIYDYPVICNLTVYQNNLYFIGYDTIHGYELRKYDGITTTMVQDLNTGIGTGVSSGAFSTSVKVFNNKLYFSGNDGVHGFELWQYDGINASMVQDINPADSLSIGPSHFEIFNNKLYFSLSDTLNINSELWQYDGTVMAKVTEINASITQGSLPQFLKTAGPYMYFNANDGIHNLELWRLEACEIQTSSHQNIINCSSSYTLPSGQNINISGTYYDTIPNTCGMDSVMVLDVYFESVNATVSQANYSLTAVQNNATYQWLNCENNSEIPNETNQTYTALNNGNYAVVVTDTITGCTDTSACYAIGGIGLEKNKAFGISLFPNPSKGVVYLQSKTNVKIEVFNTLGQLVNVNIVKQQNNSLQLNFNNHPKGTYLLKIITDQGVLVKKVLIE